MADRGSYSSTLTGGSDFMYDYTCDLCEQDDLHMEALGYCRNCSDYLCAECYRTHRRPTPLRDHVLLDKDHMPQHPKCDQCLKDGKSLDAEGFCTDCGDYLCKECFHTHLKPRPLRNHVLLDKSKMPRALQDRGDDEKTRVEYIEDILVKSKDDETCPFISGCAVLGGNKLALVDVHNSKVKLIDLSNNSLSAEMKLPQFLWDVTHVNSSQIAITSHSKKTIYFVNITDTPTLEVDHKVKVGGDCRGLVCTGDKLVVSYENFTPRVEILSLTGKVLQTVATEDLNKPYYIAVNSQATIIYIADDTSSKITSVSFTGKVLETYETERPNGLTVDKAGALYVCEKEHDCLTQYSGDLTQIRELLQNCGGYQGPNSICYCKVTDRLYIGSCDMENVQVYQLK